ncbi:hypothetical protein M407DRAFT_20501 [Tulasnella calospora MUT 4182]|uniref:Uncharacterized protein n=1 Tax=Tulasnella calospora MUT 4182 TaxID=1051891 RepID=A0A0C3QPY7_9AGAM|nr:hypothetical protein M407DRAFT_20501 [Tulasnella calospora MUT 4182]
MRRIRNFFSFRAKVDLSDEQYVTNEKERDIEWTVNPFREPHTGLADKDSQEENREPPPEWLELAGDLAWTATFSSLTSNTAITEYSAVWNYAVFFCLAWHLWATQAAYDIRFYTHDWFHRICFVIQLGIYAIIAACSGSFNVGWKVAPGWTKVFTDGVTALTAQAMEGNQKYLITKSFRGINIWLFLSRMLLSAQYWRVHSYRKRSKQYSSWRFLLMPLATFSAGILFLVCYIVIREEPDSKIAAIVQIAFWVLAVGLQFLAGVFTPREHEGALKSENHLAPRLASLTVIILGEGLNGICGTLRHSINSLGLSSTMGWQSVAVLCILYCIWLLYFDGFKIKEPLSRAREEIWLYLHVFLHLSLILLLEGVKNVFIFVNVQESINRLFNGFKEVWDEYGDTGSFPEHPTLEKLLQVLDASWQQEKATLLDAIAKDDAAPPGEGINVASQIWRWYGGTIHDVILTKGLSMLGMARHQLYNDEKDKEGEFKYDTFAKSNNTAIANDLASDDSPLFSDFYGRYIDIMAYTGQWIVIVAGLLVFLLAIVNIVQRQPKNRFARAYSVNRFVIGGILIILGAVKSSWIYDDKWMKWIIPAITLVYSGGVILDWAILRLSVHSIRSTESLSAQLPSLLYGHGRAQQSESSPSGTDAQGPKGSSGLLYAPGGETEKSHGEKSISSSG